MSTEEGFAGLPEYLQPSNLPRNAKLSELVAASYDALNAQIARLTAERDALQQQLKESGEILQAVLDAVKGTLDTSAEIADHPNVKFVQMRLRSLVIHLEKNEACPDCSPGAIVSKNAEVSPLEIPPADTPEGRSYWQGFAAGDLAARAAIKAGGKV